MLKSIVIITAFLLYSTLSGLSCLADNPATRNAESQDLVNRINAQLRENWSKQLDLVAKKTKENPVVVTYFFDKNCAVRNPKIINSSKSDDIDNKILSAISQIKVKQNTYQNSSEMVLENRMFSSIFIGKDVYTDSLKLEMQSDWLPACDSDPRMSVPDDLKAHPFK